MSAKATKVTNINIAADTTKTLLPANPYRTGASFYNNASQVLYISLVAPATENSAAAMLAPASGTLGGYYELPYGYTGPVYGIWAATGTGKVNITEFI
jgi:hypothetical protein